MPICENLKRLRTQRGLTQAELAQRLGVTRQAISSYESGRTTPDPETLKRLAAILGTDFDGLLYGQSKAERRRCNACRAALAVLAVLLLATLVQSLILWIANRFYAVPPGMAGDDPLVLTRFRLLRARETAQALLITLAQFGSLLLLFLTVPLEQPVPLRKKALWLALLALGMAAFTLPFAWNDPIYSVTEYVYRPLITFVEVALALVIGLTGEGIVRYHRTRKKRDRT